ncbi:hypothetical protein V8C42DRAFT_288742 [Trichoderma barbatum]
MCWTLWLVIFIKRHTLSWPWDRALVRMLTLVRQLSWMVIWILALILVRGPILALALIWIRILTLTLVLVLILTLVLIRSHCCCSKRRNVSRIHLPESVPKKRTLGNGGINGSIHAFFSQGNLYIYMTTPIYPQSASPLFSNKKRTLFFAQRFPPKDVQWAAAYIRIRPLGFRLAICIVHRSISPKRLCVCKHLPEIAPTWPSSELGSEADPLFCFCVDRTQPRQKTLLALVLFFPKWASCAKLLPKLPGGSANVPDVVICLPRVVAKGGQLYNHATLV